MPECLSGMAADRARLGRDDGIGNGCILRRVADEHIAGGNRIRHRLGLGELSVSEFADLSLSSIRRFSAAQECMFAEAHRALQQVRDLDRNGGFQGTDSWN